MLRDSLTGTSRIWPFICFSFMNSLRLGARVGSNYNPEKLKTTKKRLLARAMPSTTRVPKQ